MNKKVFFITLLSILTLIILLFFIRLFSDVELDDLHPSIQCDEELIQNSDILWVVPLFDNDSISNHSDWCSYLLSFNKTLGLHGVYHTYREFGTLRDQDYLGRGIEAFNSCFGFSPEKFKPPQVYWNNYNDKLLFDNNLSYHGVFNQFTHKVYHCSDTGEFPNWLIKIF